MNFFLGRPPGQKSGVSPLRRAAQARSRKRRSLSLDLCRATEMRLEPRTLMAQWVALGPAPIVNGQTPGVSQAASGRITGIATSPTDAGTIYIAAAGGGVWKTTNAGVSWTPMTDGQQTLSMGAIAVAPSNGKVLYAGTGEANNAGDSNFGVGILRSTDAGATWTLSKGPANIFETAGLTTSKIAVDPTNPNIVYAAMANLGENKAFRDGTGIYKSTDGGVTWFDTTSSINTNVAYSDVEINPATPSTLYMAVGSVFGSTSNGVYESTNSGASWTALNLGVANTDYGRTSIAIAPTNPMVIYATVESASTSGVLLVARTDDGGATWSNVTPTVNYMGGQGWYDQWVIVNPTNPANVYVGGSAGDSSPVLESTNSGVTWSEIGSSSSGNGGNGPHADHHAAAFTADGKLLDGNDGGIWRLDNPSTTSIKWTDLNSALSTIQFQSIALNPTDPTIALGGSQDNGTERYTGSLGWTLTDGGDGGEVAFSQQDPSIAYHVAPIASFGPTNYFRKSTDGGKTWGSYANGLPSSGNSEEGGPSQNTNFYAPFSVDPNNGSRLILGSSDLYISTDAAVTWTNLTAGKTGWPSTNPVDALAISHTNAGKTIYASISSGSGSQVLVSTDDGQTWATKDLPTGTGRVSDLEIDATNDQIAYATTSSFGTTSTSHVFRTTNGGGSWTSISGNLPDLPTWSLKIDPNTPNTFYVGNDTGVFVTTNLGATWNPMGTGLPDAQVLQLDLNSTYNTLGAATHGRGLFEIPTVAVLVTIVNPASANPNPVLGKTTQLSVLAADPDGESTLTYTWSTTSTPVGVPTPTFSSNGTNAAKTDTATFYASGSYTFQVRVRNAQGQSVTSSVVVNVTPVFQSIAITPSKVQLAPNATQQFTASGADQFGNPIINSNSSATWSLTSGGGTVSQSGLYTAPSSGTIAVVTAVSGTYSRSSTVYVLSNPWGTTDIGGQSVAGFAGDNSAGTFTLAGGGSNISGTTDQFQYVNQTLTGNSTILARVVNQQNTNPNAEAGIMFRADTTATAADVTLSLTQIKFLILEYRKTAGGAATSISIPAPAASYYLKLVRSIANASNTYTASYSTDGVTFTPVGTPVSITTGATDNVGLVLTSGGGSIANTTIFDHVDADSTPTIAVSASVSPSPVTTATAKLSALGADPEGESFLNYTWQTTSAPAGAFSPTFAINGTNAAKLDTVTFYKSGSYTFLVTATNLLGYSATSSVTVSVISTSSYVKLTPLTATVPTGQTFQFVTALYDQFGIKVAKQPLFTYSIVAGGAGGKVSSTGLYTAPNRTGVDYVNVTGAGTAAVAMVNVIFSASLARIASSPPALVGSVSASWGASGSAALVTATDGVRLLPIGRSTDIPWAGIRSVVVNLSKAGSLTSSDVQATGIAVANYGPVVVSPVAGSPSSYLITLARPINAADRVTLTIGNAQIATFARRLDVLPGDVNDDGIVDSADATLASNSLLSLNIFADVLGEGSVTPKGVRTIQLLNGTKLPMIG